jgi:hypothetical protein
VQCTFSFWGAELLLPSDRNGIGAHICFAQYNQCLYDPVRMCLSGVRTHFLSRTLSPSPSPSPLPLPLPVPLPTFMLRHTILKAPSNLVDQALGYVLAKAATVAANREDRFRTTDAIASPYGARFWTETEICTRGMALVPTPARLK